VRLPIVLRKGTQFLNHSRGPRPHTGICLTSSVSAKLTQVRRALRTWVHEQHVNAGRLCGDLPLHFLRLVEVLDAARPARQQVVSSRERRAYLLAKSSLN
jgi:hypothetical protein